LPGDLGRPIVAALSSSAPGSLAIDPEQQRVNQESEAARSSKVFANTNVRPPSSEGPSNVTMSTDEAFTQNRQDRKRAFLNASADRRATNPDRLVRPASPFVVQAGPLSGGSHHGIRSDLPGQITVQVTEAAYDSPTGQYLLIPQRARLIGVYDSQVAFTHRWAAQQCLIRMVRLQ
jgi:type IV secretion system protein VirB10